MPMPTCDVCGKEAIGVCCASMGPISLAYCRECLDARREPYFVLVGGLSGCSSLADIREDIHECIKVSLAFAGKTEADLFAEIKQNDDEYYAHMNKLHDA